MTSQSTAVRPAVEAGRARRKILHSPWFYVAPALILLITFTYVPVGNMIWYSFHKWDGLDVTMDPVGLDNYVRVFTDEQYWRVFLISLYYFVASFAQIAIALYFAVVLSFSVRFKNLFKGILFFPYLLNGVAVGFVFLYLFQPDGTLDSLLSAVGLGEHTKLWLGDPDIANISLAGTSVWRFTGLNFVLFLGAIQSIPGEIYEAAEIDGANRWHQFRHIIVPGIRRIISLSFILAISGSLSVFEIPFIMTGGANGTRTFVVQAYQTAFQFRQIGLASAMAVVLLLIVLLITWIQRRVLPDEEVTLS
ncbi:multiple sugar transport system permease protein [Actinoplanes octamycinicus]|uniref:Multiple sugar transport system permease protein n=1 Tax=Actinoplanes octamycinicus TaxID=135948 RepID=A0A7W7GXV7_9ACTN|nr:sugar ABC transporter permease [Actinoplanes octamycinicus]MBB4740320.1 multiple sugar transport system permease protein [Actinoplanes octamycinicus]GIE62604.1 ABC transporter permease [Actinoplanes octamycinicus]